MEFVARLAENIGQRENLDAVKEKLEKFQTNPYDGIDLDAVARERTHLVAIKNLLDRQLGEMENIRRQSEAAGLLLFKTFTQSKALLNCWHDVVTDSPPGKCTDALYYVDYRLQFDDFKLMQTRAKIQLHPKFPELLDLICQSGGVLVCRHPLQPHLDEAITTLPESSTEMAELDALWTYLVQFAKYIMHVERINGYPYEHYAASRLTRFRCGETLPTLYAPHNFFTCHASEWSERLTKLLDLTGFRKVTVDWSPENGSAARSPLE